MSVLIKGASLPEDCPVCPMAYWNAGGSFTGCNAVSGKKFAMDDADYRNGSGRPTWCPLVEVPTPHGRLIDADKLFTWFDGDSLAKYPIGDAKQYNTIMYYEVFGEIDDAPTVIEAEGE